MVGPVHINTVIRWFIYKCGRVRSSINMLDLMNDMIGNVIDRVREPFCMASNFARESARCDDPAEIPVPDFTLWKYIPISDEQKIEVKKPFCRAIDSLESMLHCDA